MAEAVERFLAPFRYYGRVLWRALRDTVRHVVAKLLVGLALALIGAGLQCRWQPRGQPCDMSALHAALVTIGVYVAVVLIFNVVMAPFRLHREAQEERDQQQAQLKAQEDEDERQMDLEEIRVTLAAFHRSGDRIAQEIRLQLNLTYGGYPPPATVHAPAGWSDEYAEWLGDVRNFLGRHKGLGPIYLRQFDAHDGLPSIAAKQTESGRMATTIKAIRVQQQRILTIMERFIET